MAYKKDNAALEKHDHPKTNLAGEVSNLLKAFQGKVLEQLLLDALPLGLRQGRRWNLVQGGNGAEALVVVTAAVPLRFNNMFAFYFLSFFLGTYWTS